MNNRYSILIVEDEKSIVSFMKTILTANDYDVLVARDGEQALMMVNSHCPDMIILDLGLPDMDGLKIIKAVREWSQVPIIVVSARSREQDKVMALDLGADDYVTKPFTPLELMARVNSQLRRYTQFANRSPKEEKNDRIHVIGGLELNEDTVEVFVDGKPVKMTPIEFKILALLIRTPGRVYSTDEIYERVWNEKAINTDTIMVHVRNIRDKIEINPRDPKYLKVVWGVGYKIEKQQ